MMETSVAALSFDQYYEADYRSLLGLAIVLCGSHHVAEDLCHDAMAEAHKRWDDVQHYDDPGAWVRRVMVNKSRSRFRRLRSERTALSVVGRRPDEVIEPTDSSEEVWAALRKLPRRQGQAVALFYWEDRSLEQIAEILGCGPETVKTHLKRGRAALSRTLAGPEEQS